MIHIEIVGTGRCLPNEPVENAEVALRLNTSDAWIRERTGIERRHYVYGKNLVEIASEAATNALDAARVQPGEVDLIVVATISGDMIFPSTAASVQDRLGIRRVACFDVSAACSGFLYALSIADGFVAAGRARHALVIGAEAMSRLVDPADRSTSVLFGDGAGAVVIKRSTTDCVGSIDLYADGASSELLNCAPLLRRPFISMNGPAVFRIAVRAMVQAIEGALLQSGLCTSDIDWFVPHQANRRIIESVAASIGIPMDRVVLTLQDHANTSAASIPMALDVAVRDGRIQSGHTLLMAAAGGGFTWAAGIMRWV